jgi:pilus assembly protein Flp/PilA
VKFRPTRQSQKLSVAAGWKGRPKPSNSFAERNEFMFRNFLKDESGLELSEYAVAAALVAVATVAAFQLVGTNIGMRISTLAGYIK